MDYEDMESGPCVDCGQSFQGDHECPLDGPSEDEKIAARVNENTEKLHQQFAAFKETCQKVGHVKDHRTIYESWIIQKISGLQCAIDELNKAIGEYNERK